MYVVTYEVGYTPAMPRREDHEVHKDMCWWQWIKKKHLLSDESIIVLFFKKFLYNKLRWSGPLSTSLLRVTCESTERIRHLGTH